MRSKAIKTSANEISTSPSDKCEPVPEVPLLSSPGIKEVFDVEIVRQQMTVDDNQDIPIDEPGLDLELEDDLDDEGNMNESDKENLSAPECDMVYVLSAKYALPVSEGACQTVDLEGG